MISYPENSKEAGFIYATILVENSSSTSIISQLESSDKEGVAANEDFLDSISQETIDDS